MPQPPGTLAPGTNAASLLMIPTIKLLTHSCTTTWLTLTLSVMVLTMAPDVPCPEVLCGPTSNQAVPVYTFNCALTVLYQRSPTTLLDPLGAELLDVAAEIVLNVLPL